MSETLAEPCIETCDEGHKYYRPQDTRIKCWTCLEQGLTASRSEVEQLMAHIAEASFWLGKALSSSAFIPPEEFDRRIALAKQELDAARRESDG